MKSVLGSILGGLAGFVCIGAGVYFLLHSSGGLYVGQEYDATAIDVLIHGLGIYFVGKGLGILAMTVLLERK